MNTRYYRAPTSQVGQGDVLVDVPSLRILSSRLEIVRRRTGKAGPSADLFEVEGERQPQKRFDPNDDETVAKLQLGMGMILSNACDWDNSPTAPVQVALVRPLRLLPEDAHSAIREGANARFLHLPENDYPELEESYVDFARVTSIRADVLAHFERLVSPSQTLLSALYVALTYFYSRCEPDRSAVGASAARALAEADGG